MQNLEWHEQLEFVDNQAAPSVLDRDHVDGFEEFNYFVICGLGCLAVSHNLADAASPDVIKDKVKCKVF